MSKTILNVTNLGVHYKNKHVLEIKNFKVCEGDIIQLHGKNGTGKSTFLKNIYGVIGEYVLSPNAIISTEKHENILKLNEIEIDYHRSVYRYISQDDHFGEINDTVFNFIKDNIWKYDKTRSINKEEVQQMLDEYFNAKDNKQGRSTIDVNSKLSKLSGGQARMVRLLPYLKTLDYSVLLMVDEPFNNLDISSCLKINNFFNNLRRKNPKIAMIFVSHYPLLTFIKNHFFLENKTFVEGHSPLKIFPYDENLNYLDV